MIEAIGYAAQDAKAPLKPLEFDRNEIGAHYVQIDMLYCGVCHSDRHQVRNEWHKAVYPCLPGHEIVGRVVKVGQHVTQFKEGDLAGVGCMIDSCQECNPCKAEEEQYCEGPKGWTAIYNGSQKPDGSNTFGGYSNTITVKENPVLMPESLETKAVAPLLWAGSTTYSPLRHWQVKAGQKVGVQSLHPAFEAGCHGRSVGALEPLEPIDHSQVAFYRRSVAGSLIGGIAETQEVLDVCAERGFFPMLS